MVSSPQSLKGLTGALAHMVVGRFEFCDLLSVSPEIWEGEQRSLTQVEDLSLVRCLLSALEVSVTGDLTLQLNSHLNR